MPNFPQRSEDRNFHLIGVEHIRSLDDEQPVDGTEIGGSFFDEENIWGRQDEFIPEKDDIPVIRWLYDFRQNPKKYLSIKVSLF